MKLYTMKDVMEILNVTRMTLLSWEEKGKLHPMRTPGGRRRYLQEEIDLLSGSAITNTEGKVFIYCRVSTKKQQASGNLQRQKERLIGYCYDQGYQISDVFQEVASGINESRKELSRMMNRLNEVDKIVIEYPDRLARFGYKYLENHCTQTGVAIDILESNELKGPDQEMVEDLIAIITSFSVRLYGARGGRKVKQCLTELAKGGDLR
jgi:predicted site-specific integrase-resolvase